jgi:hypothetical protein
LQLTQGSGAPHLDAVDKAGLGKVVHAPNEPEDYASPTLNDDLSIRFDPLDGHVIGPVTASDVTDYVIYDKQGTAEEVRDGWLRNDNIYVYLSFPSNRGGFLYVAGWPGVILA